DYYCSSYTDSNTWVF
nr:immunoglobulin light chain junction region [Macaca mulatta]